MAPPAILHWPDPRLMRKSAPVAAITPAISQLAGDLLAAMYAAEGRGLAAPQIGVLQRVFVADAGWKSGAPAPQVFVNPQILWASGVTALGAEGCLSIPGPSPLIRRAQAIVLAWQDLEGRAHQARLAGFMAILAQHETDHLEGILTLDHLPADARALAEGAAA